MERERDIEAEDYYEMAGEWVRGGNLAGAEECYVRAIRANPRFIYAYIDLARVYDRQGSHADAIHTIRGAIRHDPSFSLLYYLLARYSFRNGEYGSALRTIDHALELEDRELYRRVRVVIERYYRRQPR